MKKLLFLLVFLSSVLSAQWKLSGGKLVPSDTTRTVKVSLFELDGKASTPSLISKTWNAPPYSSSVLGHDYYPFVGVSEDAIMGLISKGEGGHGSGIDLIEVDSTNGALINKWHIGRESTQSTARLYFTWTNSNEYFNTPPLVYLDTLGKFSAITTTNIVLSSAVGNVSREIGRDDSTGALTIRGDTLNSTAGAWTAFYARAHATQAGNILHNANNHTFRSRTGGSTFGTFSSTGLTMTGTATVGKLKINSAGGLIDSAKVVSDTLKFYIGGSAYSAIKD